MERSGEQINDLEGYLQELSKAQQNQTTVTTTNTVALRVGQLLAKLNATQLSQQDLESMVKRLSVSVNQTKFEVRNTTLPPTSTSTSTSTTTTVTTTTTTGTEGARIDKVDEEMSNYSVTVDKMQDTIQAIWGILNTTEGPTTAQPTLIIYPTTTTTVTHTSTTRTTRTSTTKTISTTTRTTTTRTTTTHTTTELVTTPESTRTTTTSHTRTTLTTTTKTTTHTPEEKEAALESAGSASMSGCCATEAPAAREAAMVTPAEMIQQMVTMPVRVPVPSAVPAAPAALIYGTGY